MVLVIEGLARPLLDRWIKQGHLPAFERLRSRGMSGEFMSENVPYEPSTLATAFTGHPIGDHGCYSYWTAQPFDYRPKIIVPDDLKRPFLWNRHDLAGLTFGVINVFGTHPPGSLDGWLITYPTQRTLRACFPPYLIRDLSQSGIGYVHDVLVWFSGGPRDVFVNGAIKADEARAATAQWLWDVHEPDVLIGVFTAVDRLSHVYWQEIEDGSPMAETESAVFRAYRQSDELLDAMLRRVDDRTSLLVFSDVGFGPLRGYCSVDDHLAASGVLVQETTTSDIRWSDTLAFETIQGSHGVNINLRGRQVNGIVDAVDYDRVRQDVTAVLLEMVNPYTGLPLFERVVPREEAYSGTALIQAPDLIVRPADDRYLPLGEKRWARHVNRRLQSGWHRRETWWGGMGPTFEGGCGRTGMALDVAPTILRMVGRDPLPEFTGQPLGVT